ncbi:MAG: Fur family transcriptional regulator [Sphingobacterium sp.]|uniref:Fur family transcriptional regulator n=1 Tax=Sphingobacterium sp. JB170 TaxID=1434842 RepID=UPI00097F5E11|nr:transcriptional repressor [Sphingobacterium sp. JB170]SJN40230.1 Zinc uptake regulation protein ZUR [Sphingobacterium sp. JB170]
MTEQKKEKSRDFNQLLRDNGLKVTPHRLRVLDELTHKNAAVSQPDLEKTIGAEIDRVTLYRILSSFEDQGIVHKIFDLQGTATYAICNSDCRKDHHQDQHVHFICSVCNSVYCLDEVPFPYIPLPKNFTLHALALNAVGLCENCQKEE